MLLVDLPMYVTNVTTSPGRRDLAERGCKPGWWRSSCLTCGVKVGCESGWSVGGCARLPRKLRDKTAPWGIGGYPIS
eukprot:993897-Prorocentrum_minimum.AAC.4